MCLLEWDWAGDWAVEVEEKGGGCVERVVVLAGELKCM